MQLEQEEGLWLVFCVAGNHYAIDSTHVGGVMIMPEEVTAVPAAERHVHGIVRERGGIITVLDLRVLFGNLTIKEEEEQFRQNMDKAREAHIAWVEELRDSVKEQRRFHKSTDAHQCAFGVWYDNYRCPIQAVRAKMALIEEPHEKLHQVAVRVNQLVESQGGEASKLSLERALQEAEDYKAQVLTFIRAAEQAFYDSFRTMMVILKNDSGRSIALMVDEIVSVEKLQTVFHDDTLEKMNHSKLIGSVALDSTSENLLLLVDENQVFELGQKAEEAVRQAASGGNV